MFEVFGPGGCKGKAVFNRCSGNYCVTPGSYFVKVKKPGLTYGKSEEFTINNGRLIQPEARSKGLRQKGRGPIALR